MDPATVTIQLQPADIRRFTNFAAGGLYRRLILFFALLFFGINLLISLSEKTSHGPLLQDREFTAKVIGSLAFFLIYTVFFLVVVRVVLWWASSRSVYRNTWPAAFLPNTYSVLNEGLFCENELGETLNYWKFIKRFVEQKDHFYIMLSKRRGHVIPKRCFPTLEAGAVFANQVRLQLEKHAPEVLAGAAR
jgi:hypothetical protein